MQTIHEQGEWSHTTRDMSSFLHTSNEKESFHQTKKLKVSPDRRRVTSANQTIKGGGNAFNSMSAATKFSTKKPSG
jgi:hypothetical protein